MHQTRPANSHQDFIFSLSILPKSVMIALVDRQQACDYSRRSSSLVCCIHIHIFKKSGKLIKAFS